MLKKLFVASLTSAFLATAQTEVPEPTNFNVTAALKTYGVDVSKVPALAGRPNGCAVACNALSQIFGADAVHTPQEVSYNTFTDAYWSLGQIAVDPSCIFVPSQDIQVSAIVLLLRLTTCPFAAKSGGHAAFAGASSIQGGITVSFEKLNQIVLNGDKGIASIGPGRVWGTVYEELTKQDLTVIGGRLYNIGVGGLTTGGGISYLSGRNGWANDNVESFVVVLANGVPVTASATSYPDLYWALRGGGNNFGLVIKFNYRTYSLPGGKLWGGTKYYTEDKFPAISSAFTNLVNNAPEDPDAGAWMVWAYYQGQKLCLPTYWHAKPNSGTRPIRNAFNAIQSISDTTGNRVLADWARETNNEQPGGSKQSFYVISSKADLGILNYAVDVFYQEVLAVASVPGLIPTIVVQGITIPILKAMKRNGGNPLGLDEADGPFLIIQLAAGWTNPSDDNAVYSYMSKTLTRISDEAKRRGVYNDYVYMNYGSQFQDVIASYGQANKDRLKSIATRYDTRKVFQELQPGYFKLDRAPVTNSGRFSF